MKSKIKSQKEKRAISLSLENGLILSICIFICALIVTNYTYYKINSNFNYKVYNLNMDEMNYKYVAQIQDYDEKMENSTGFTSNWYRFCKNLTVRNAVDDYFAREY